MAYFFIVHFFFSPYFFLIIVLIYMKKILVLSLFWSLILAFDSILEVTYNLGFILAEPETESETIQFKNQNIQKRKILINY